MFSPSDSFRANESIQTNFPIDFKGIGTSADDMQSVLKQEQARVSKENQSSLPILIIEQGAPYSSTTSSAEVVSSLLAKRLEESAEAIREATGQDNWIARWTDEDTIFMVLKEKTDQERALLAEIYESKYRISLEDELKRNLNGAEEDQALNLLKRDDGNMRDLQARTLHTDLIDIDQKFFGRNRAELETEVRNIFAGMSRDQIAELQTAYKAIFNQDLIEAVNRSEKMSQATKDAVTVYLKGADVRTDADAMQLAENALKLRDVERFQEAMRDASQAARQQFLSEGGADKILAAFGLPDNQRSGATIASKESLNALDYAEHGKLSAARQVEANTGAFHFTSNTSGVEAALAAMTEDERDLYSLGRAQSQGRPVDQAVTDATRQKALEYYNDLHGALQRVGNETEMIAWEDQIAHKGGSVVSDLAKHRGTIYDDSVAEMCGTVEKMSESDWQLLRDPAAGAEFRKQIEAMLDTYASAGEKARVMEIVDKKAAAGSFEAAADQGRSILDALEDRRHWFTANDAEGMLNDICSMSVDEQAKYRSDEKFRKAVDEMVDDSLGNTAKDAAHELLQMVLRGEKPEHTLLTSLELRAGEQMSTWARVQAVRRDLEKFFDADPTLRERLNHPVTEEDRAFSKKINDLACHSLSEKYVGEYIKPMLQEGSLDLMQVIKLDMLSGESEKIFEDCARAPENRRSALLANIDKNEALRLMPADQLEVLKNVLASGCLNPEDGIRAKIVSWGQGEEIMQTLRALGPEELESLKASYAARYSEDLTVDLLDKLSGERKHEAEKIILSTKQTDEERLVDLMQQGSQSHSGFGAAFTDGFCNVGTGYQIDASVNDVVSRLAEAARSNRELTADEIRQFSDTLETVNQNYRDSKAAAANYTVTALMAAAAAAGTPFTGGSSWAMFALMVPTGAAVKFGTNALIMGSDYDFSQRQVATDLISGGINGGVNVIGGSQIAKLCGVNPANMSGLSEIGFSAAAGGLGGGLSGMTEAIGRQENGEEILRSTLAGGTTGALFAAALSTLMVGGRRAYNSLAGDSTPAIPADSPAAMESADASTLQSVADDARVPTAEVAPPRTGKALMDAIKEGAEQNGYPNAELFAVSTLKNADEIAEFARAFKAQYGDAAMQNLKFARESGLLFVPGTEDVWDKVINDLQAMDVPRVASIADDVAPAPQERVFNSLKENQEVFDELTAAGNRYAFKKALLNPGDAGYYEATAYPISQVDYPNGLRVSSKEMPMTLSADLVDGNGNVWKAGTQLPRGTVFDGISIRSADPADNLIRFADGRVLPNGTVIPQGIEIAGGQQTVSGDWVLVRHTTDNGVKILDTYTPSGKDMTVAWRPVDGSPGQFTPNSIPREMVEIPAGQKFKIWTKRGFAEGVGPAMMVKYENGSFNIVSAKDLVETYTVPVDERSAERLARLKSEI